MSCLLAIKEDKSPEQIIDKQGTICHLSDLTRGNMDGTYIKENLFSLIATWDIGFRVSVGGEKAWKPLGRHLRHLPVFLLQPGMG